jgi:hypothetical protein
LDQKCRFSYKIIHYFKPFFSFSLFIRIIYKGVCYELSPVKSNVYFLMGLGSLLSVSSCTTLFSELLNLFCLWFCINLTTCLFDMKFYSIYFFSWIISISICLLAVSFVSYGRERYVAVFNFLRFILYFKRYSCSSIIPLTLSWKISYFFWYWLNILFRFSRVDYWDSYANLI